MLDDLVETIRTLQNRIRDHGSHIGAYESRTRVTLINPMLSALGWDVSDPQSVHVEPKTENGWADYALLGTGHKVVIYLEAKKLSEDISKHTQQTVGYAIAENMQNNTNIRYCALTNGDRWEVYDLSPPQRPVMRVSIAEEEIAKCALKFLGLWRQSLQDGSFEQAVEPLIEVESDAAPHPIAQVEVAPTPQLAPPQTATQPSAPVGVGWVPLTVVKPKDTNAVPGEIRFSDGKTQNLESWTGVLEETAKWLIHSGIVTPKNCEFRWSGNPKNKRYLLNLTGAHPHKPFEVPRQVGGGIMLEAHLDRNEAVTQAVHLLNGFNQDPSQVHLKL